VRTEVLSTTGQSPCKTCGRTGNFTQHFGREFFRAAGFDPPTSA
jgi:hypothetical protein